VTPLGVGEAVFTVDVAPTIAEILGIASPTGLDGRSRLDLLGDTSPPAATETSD